MNADDWGQDRTTTDAILSCIEYGTVSATSAMVFMQDSMRAAAIALERGVDTGLHLNLTSPLTGAGTPARVADLQARVTRYLRVNRVAQLVFNPALMRAFEYVTRHQVDEYTRLYGRRPARVDGHHHMHLCANVRWQRLLPEGIVVRRNFCFHRGEKGAWNRLYRRHVDGRLARRHQLADFLFNIQPLNASGRLERILRLAHTSIVELETHPANPDEWTFLQCAETRLRFLDAGIGPPSVVFRSGAV